MTRIAATLLTLALVSGGLVSGSTLAQPAKPGTPKVLRYVSQRTEKANMREGCCGSTGTRVIPSR